MDAPGENLLVECASVFEVVRCAVVIQQECNVRNAELPPHRRMGFRSGINLGDVIAEWERIYGDGVNIAVRREGRADTVIEAEAGPRPASQLIRGRQIPVDMVTKHVKKVSILSCVRYVKRSTINFQEDRGRWRELHKHARMPPLCALRLLFPLCQHPCNIHGLL